MNKHVEITKEKKAQRKSIEIPHPLNFESSVEVLIYAVDSGISLVTRHSTGNVGTVQKLLKGNKVLAGYADNFGRTLLHKAVLSENLNMVRLLLENHVDINSQDKNGNKHNTQYLLSEGWTALHYAVDSQSNNSELLKLLLKQSNIRVDIPNSDNNLPIHYFSKRSYFDQGTLYSISYSNVQTFSRKC